jgi:isoleucyl-tRNA synthetase
MEKATRGFTKRFAKRERREKFILHDGPPYANADIHIGTALNKILERFRRQIALDDGFRRAVCARLRLPRLAD